MHFSVEVDRNQKAALLLKVLARPEVKDLHVDRPEKEREIVHVLHLVRRLRLLPFQISSVVRHRHPSCKCSD